MSLPELSSSIDTVGGLDLRRWSIATLCAMRRIQFENL